MVVVLAVFGAVQSPEWACNCDGMDRWRYVGPDGIKESESHLRSTGHATSCRRNDRAAKITDRLYGLIFADLKR
ncbi:hypothetical protein [Xanthomonas bromi]|uniref:Secreted protein n=2 Tax=Xanthomonas bromi TaxID=56449 RepID=A0ABX5BQS7_9XANT|nr:hypothetical protein [Xanthomonas bromi]PPV05910.1 hypothetical protein XbrCFBP1976_14830 [Xanthomonas bromi]